MRFLRLVLFLLLAAIGASCAYADTDPDPRLMQLEAALNQLDQEQQSLYKQFQITQELRRNAFENLNPVNPRSLDYGENVRLQRQAVEMLEKYDRDLNAAYSRYLEIGEQKKALLDQIMELALPPAPQ